MPITITTLDESLAGSNPKIIIYADAGVGKTTLAGTLPGKILILSAESGLRSLQMFPSSTRRRIQVAEVVSTDDMREVYDRVLDGRIVVDWLVIDSISEIAEIAIREYKKKDKDPRQSYGKTDDDVTDMFRAFRDLPCGVVFIAKEHAVKRQISEGVEVDYYGLLLPGQRLTTNVPHLVDEVWRMVARGEKRFLITRNDGRSRAKSRTDLPSLVDVSDGISPEVLAALAAVPLAGDEGPGDISDS